MSLLSDLINLNVPSCTDKIIAEYIWIGGSGMDLRSKARTLPGPVSDPSKLPTWNYDGSSTKQAVGEDSEVILYPQAIYKDPFRRGNNILVMCDSDTPQGNPIPGNTRYNALKVFSHSDVIAEEPWFDIEQEYTLLQKDIKGPMTLITEITQPSESEEDNLILMSTEIIQLSEEDNNTHLDNGEKPSFRAMIGRRGDSLSSSRNSCSTYSFAPSLDDVAYRVPSNLSSEYNGDISNAHFFEISVRSSSHSNGNDLEEAMGNLVLQRKRQPIVGRYMSNLFKRNLKLFAMVFPKVSSHTSQGFESYMKSERNCYMLGARELSIAWGNDTRYWKWGHVPDSRDQKVAILQKVWWLDIQGKISSVMLSPKTVYAAYLVFQIPKGSSGLSGLGKAKVSYGGVQNESNIPLQQMMVMAHAQPPRKVGWMEIELGTFYCDDGYEGDVEMVFQEHDRYKEGLIVKGIEIRPVYGNSRSYK